MLIDEADDGSFSGVEPGVTPLAIMEYLWAIKLALQRS